MTMTRMAGARPRRAKVVVGILMGMLLLPSVGVASAAEGGSSAETSGGGLEVVGKLPAPDFTKDSEEWDEESRAGSGYLILNPATRRGYQVFNTFLPKTTIVQSFDIDTLEPLKRMRYPGFWPMSAGGGGEPRNSNPGEVIHAVDEEGGRLFLPLTRNNSLDRPDKFVGGNQAEFRGLLVIDEAGFEEASCTEGVCEGEEVEEFTDVWEPSPDIGTKALHGLTFFRRAEQSEGKLLFLFDGRASRDHRLVQWDAADGEGDWSYLLDSCSGAVLRQSGFYELGIVRGSDAIHLGCQASKASAQAVSIPLDEGGRPDPGRNPETFVLGRSAVDVLADPDGERLLFWEQQGEGTKWWIFDGGLGAWAGLIGATPGSVARGYMSAGIDPASGRVYTLVPHHTFVDREGEQQAVQGGIGMADGRLTPVPQLDMQLPELAYPGIFRIAVDPATEDRPRRIFVRRGGRHIENQTDYPSTETVETPPEFFYWVIEDRKPVVTEVPEEDPDRFTSGHPEEPGVTTATFDGAGAGYGARSLLVSGLDAVLKVSDIWVPDFAEEAGIPLRSSCTARDREVVFGASGPTRYSQDGAVARAGSLGADGGTRVDLDRPATRCWPWGIEGPPPGAEQFDELVGQDPWATSEEGDNNAMAAECTGDEGDEAEQGDAEARCRQDEGEVRSSSTASAFSAGPVRVAAASSWTEVFRDEERGLVSRSVAEARGVEIGGAVRVGLIRTEAEVWAAGREDTAGTSFTRKMCGVHSPEFSGGACLDEEQQQEFVEGLDRLFGGRGKARLREPDAELAEGSPGGYIAAIRRDRLDRFFDLVVNRDESVAVPGLELIRYADHKNEGSGRQIIQLAGVQASSTYGVLCLFGETPDGCERPPEAPEPVETDVEVDAAGAAGPIEPLPQQEEGGSSEPRFFEEVIPAADRSSAPQTGADEPEDEGATGVVRRVLEAPAQGLRFLLRNPGDALLLGGTWILVLGPLWLAWRRRTLRNLQEVAG